MNEDVGDQPSGPSRERTATPIHEALVERVTTLLDADCCEFLIEEDDQLKVLVSSASRPTEGNRTYPLVTGIPGRAYSTGTACVIDDLQDTRSSTSAGTAPSSDSKVHRSLCCVPVEDRGLLLAKAYRPGAFTDGDQQLVSQLVGLVEEAVERTVSVRTPVSDGGSRDSNDHAQRLEEIADILSHDLKNPLNVAQGNLELARQSGDDDFFERVSAAHDRIEELIDEVVFLAQTGDHVERTEPVDLQERAEAAWGNVQTKEATLQIDGSVTIEASQRGLCHLLENLIENAVVHGGPTVTVRIGATDTGFYVEDDGPGIPAEHHTTIFDRGFRLRDGTTGLGLHIVYQIIEAHGWSIHAGESAGGGARFEIATASD